MSGSELSIALKPLGGSWERVNGIPEGYTHTHQLPGGPATANWSQKQDTRLQDPQHGSFTEVATMIGGVPAWSGRLMRAPKSRAQESVVNPSAEGWWGHLQDYPVDREWVVTDLSRWRDARTYPNTQLSSYCQAGQVQVDGGAITLGLPKGGQMPVDHFIGVMIDLGPNAANRARLCAVTYDSSNNDASTQLYLRMHDTEQHVGTAGTDVTSIPMNTGGNGVLLLSATTMTRRYVSIFLYGNPARTMAADVTARIKAALVFTDAADVDYPAGVPPISALKASTVITEALALAPKISTDTSLITPTTFNIPAYGTSGRRTIQDVVNDVNAYHQYQALLTTDPTPRPIFRPVPTTPTWIISEDAAYSYDDAGANDGAEIVDTCILQYTDASGTPAEYIATAAGTVLSKAGYSRAKVLQARSRLTAAAAQQIAQAYVAAHQTSPFKGKIRLQGTATRYADGSQIPVGLIPAGDAFALGSEVNPDTGAPGRVGVAQKVTYRHDDLSIDAELDSARNWMDSVLARLAVVVR